MLTQINHHTHFREGIRVLALSFRNKDGNFGNKYIQRISYNFLEYWEKYEELLALGSQGDAPFRIYSSVEERCEQKAIREFKRRQLDADYDSNPLDFYKNIRSRWTSCLMEPKSVKEKYWLFDCDTDEQTNYIRAILSTTYNRDFEPYWYATKAGKHCITQPFNLHGLDVSDILHKNAMMLCAYTK